MIIFEIIVENLSYSQILKIKKKYLKSISYKLNFIWHNGENIMFLLVIYTAVTLLTMIN